MQVKGLMPPGDGISQETPPAEPLGEMWYGITFPVVQKFVISLDNFIEIAMWQKNRRCAIAHSSYETSPIMCFV